MKHFLRTYALGLLTATLIIGIYYFYLAEQDIVIEKIEMTESEMIETLESAGFYIFKTDPTKTNETEPTLEDDQTISDQLDSNLDDDDLDPTDVDQVETGNNDQTSNQSFILTIEPGMTVTQVAEFLVANEMIADRNELASYLVDNNYGTNIQIGEFELNQDMTLAEIVELIARRN
ncbi:MAG TPA: endolytic transglycosylase MltG [Bacilli bacterium]|nr:endolytic transglycosylase MltG [Bacilli bacterium]